MLRAIEQALAEQDPGLVDRLSGSRARRPATVADWVGWSLFCVAQLFLITGLVLVDSSLLRDALLVLSVLPPLVLIVAAGSSVHQ